MKFLIISTLAMIQSLPIKKRGFFNDIFSDNQPSNEANKGDGFSDMGGFFDNIMKATFDADDSDTPSTPPPSQQKISKGPLLKFEYPNTKDIEDAKTIYNKYLANAETELDVSNLFKAANTFLQTNTTNYAYLYRVLKNYPKLEKYGSIFSSSIQKQLGDKVTLSSIMTFAAVFVEQYPDVETQLINAMNEFDRTNTSGTDFLLSLLTKYLTTQPKLRNNLYTSLDEMVSQNSHYYDVMTTFVNTWTRSNKKLVKRFLLALAPPKH